ncbi:MAG: 3-phosphoshikimate 1-carboxyvinyltransferase [Planctomycetota bacterium]|nr:3-phosphoshikimate 1-carboxyvinyltransferase [Planctomycetota bacterium]
MADSYEVIPAQGPIRGSIRPPGSKSLTNRALITAALAKGTSTLTGVLESEDTRVMSESLRRLGLTVTHDTAECRLTITGGLGAGPASTPIGDSSKPTELWLENSGTSIRFLTAACSAIHGSFRLDGNSRMHERPIGDLVTALRNLGADVSCELETSCPPVLVRSQGLTGGATAIAGTISSQFLSALMMASPLARTEVKLQVEGELVSRPYVEMTRAVMADFGVSVDETAADQFVIRPQSYKATRFAIEPDASAASYFFAMAAVTGGRVTVEGLHRNSLQGDIGFVDVLERMGCRVDWGVNDVTLHGRKLHGIDVDMNEISDTAQTLAAVAIFADSPTRIRGVAHMRHKETDRVSAVATELQRLGISATEHEDGLTISPGQPQPAVVATYDDHRMAMSFALIGLKTAGIRIANPDCTAKTYPNFFEDFERVRGV